MKRHFRNTSRGGLSLGFKQCSPVMSWEWTKRNAANHHLEMPGLCSSGWPLRTQKIWKKNRGILVKALHVECVMILALWLQALGGEGFDKLMACGIGPQRNIWQINLQAIRIPIHLVSRQAVGSSELLLGGRMGGSELWDFLGGGNEGRWVAVWPQGIGTQVSESMGINRELQGSKQFWKDRIRKHCSNPGFGQEQWEDMREKPGIWSAPCWGLILLAHAYLCPRPKTYVKLILKQFQELYAAAKKKQYFAISGKLQLHTETNPSKIGQVQLHKDNNFKASKCNCIS